MSTIREVPLQQTKEWKKLQDELHLQSFFKQTSDFQFLAIKMSTPIGSYLFLPYGPHLFTKNGAKTSLEALKALAKREQAFFIRIEPQDPEKASELLTLQNCQKSHDLNPKRTWQLDLTPDKDSIIKNFATGTKRCYKDFTRKGLVVEKSTNPEDIKYLIDFQTQLAKLKNIGTFSHEYLKTEARQPFSSLYLARYQTSLDQSLNKSTNDSSVQSQPSFQSQPQQLQSRPKPANNQVIAALLFFETANTSFYMQGAEIPAFKYLPASVACMTTAMFDAKESGKTTFDFWGIAPDNATTTHPWYGFTKFKKSFGGIAIEYAGTHDIILNPVKYHLYQLLRKTNRLKHKLLR